MTQIIRYYRGLPGCGKSTDAREWVNASPGQRCMVDKDSIRRMVHDGRYSKSNEKQVEQIQANIVKDALERGLSVAVHDTGFASVHLNRFEQIAAEFRKKGRDVKVEIKDFTDVPVEECIKRDLNRQYSVGKDVIMRMYCDFVRPKPVRPKYDRNLHDAVICDLDGTFCLFDEKGHRGPYDAAKCEEDELNQALAEILSNYVKRGVTVLFTSGRTDDFKDQTESWFSTKTPYIRKGARLFMRKAGDLRKDAIIKREIYDAEIRGKYNILAVFDDRPQVCTLWYELGLPLFKYGDPDRIF